MEEGFLLMNLSKHKSWRAIKKEIRLIVCLHAAEKYGKLENANTQNDNETASKKWTDKKKTNLFFVFCKRV